MGRDILILWQYPKYIKFGKAPGRHSFDEPSAVSRNIGLAQRPGWGAKKEYRNIRNNKENDMSQQVDNKVTMQRFGEKLAAVRQGMTAQEKVMLDTMVANTAFEVSAHGISVSAIPVGEKIPIMGAAAAGAQDADVVAHAAVQGAAIQGAAAQGAAVGRNIVYRLTFNKAVGYELSELGDDEDDVQAHAAAAG
jgi:hypothetical protein